MAIFSLENLGRFVYSFVFTLTYLLIMNFNLYKKRPENLFSLCPLLLQILLHCQI